MKLRVVATWSPVVGAALAAWLGWAFAARRDYWDARSFALLFYGALLCTIATHVAAVLARRRGEPPAPELARELPAVITGDLDHSGYFSPIDKEAYLEEESESAALETVRLKNWAVIGAELLIKGGYACIGSSLEVEIRLFDVFLGRQILGKRLLGERANYRRVMHRLANEIIRTVP